MMIEEYRLNQMEAYLYAIIVITNLLREANKNLDGIQNTIKIYERIENLARRIDTVMFKLG